MDYDGRILMSKEVKKVLLKSGTLLLGIAMISVCTLFWGYELLPIADILFGLPLLMWYIRSTQELISYKWRGLFLGFIWVIFHGIQHASIFTFLVEDFFGKQVPLLSESFIAQEQMFLSVFFSRYVLMLFPIFFPISLVILSLIAFWTPAIHVLIIDAVIMFFYRAMLFVKN